MSCGRLSTSYLLITWSADLSTRLVVSRMPDRSTAALCVVHVVSCRSGRRAAELRWLENERRRDSRTRPANSTRIESHRVARRRGRRTHSTAPHHWRGSRYRTSRPASYAVREQTSRLNCIHRAAQLHSQGAVREQTSRSRRSTAPDASLTHSGAAAGSRYRPRPC